MVPEKVRWIGPLTDSEMSAITTAESPEDVVIAFYELAMPKIGMEWQTAESVDGMWFAIPQSQWSTIAECMVAMPKVGVNAALLWMNKGPSAYDEAKITTLVTELQVMLAERVQALPSDVVRREWAATIEAEEWYPDMALVDVLGALSSLLGREQARTLARRALWEKIRLEEMP